MQFYLPNFEDMVDPEYDFLNDQPSPKRRNRRIEHDWYAHRFFGEPIFDGMLISKTTISPKIEDHIRQAGGLHSFLRLYPTIPIMGDCGAFSYRNLGKPPYGVNKILDYYQDLGFTYGVSIDHVVFPAMPAAERRRRQKITLRRAKTFFNQHRVKGYTFQPVGIAQGWDAVSRREAMKQLIEIGYQHLALGGIAYSSNEEILETLQAIKPILPSGVTLHIFGVARLELIPDFIRLGVTSADSAAPIRRAFLGSSGDNYWTRDGFKYAAIRVPEAEGKRSKRGVDSVEEVLQRNGKLSAASLVKLEQEALRLLRAYDKGKATLDQTLEAVLAYDRLYGDKRDHEKAYRRTLADKPWQACGCPICEAVGVEVIIFRGNNRNRRRGFHNAKVFYDQFRETIQATYTRQQSASS
jgi:hypothetical protein